MTICVAHLARASNGLDPFDRFLESYARHRAGAPHRLLIVFKGFLSPAQLTAHDRLLRDMPHDRIHVRDHGYDIRAYLVAARATHFDRYCFLNSFSVIRDDDWLAKLGCHAAPGSPDVAGATGSWISHLTSNVSDPAFGRRLRVAGSIVSVPEPLSSFLRLKWRRMYERSFDPFPNFHVRTNAFVVGRDLLLGAAPATVRTKLDAFKFESGRSGLSGLAKARGGRLVVVGRDGKAYAEHEWADSRTFWQGDQENLLVADNQTARYDRADVRGRIELSTHAWGDRARPARPLPAAREGAGR